MFTAAWDEPFALPSEETATLALRTQQILAFETGVTRTVDPLGGSYFVESLTDAMEVEILRIMEAVEQRGGIVAAIETGQLQVDIGDAAGATSPGSSPATSSSSASTSTPLTNPCLTSRAMR